MELKHLLTPGKIGTLSLKNRMLMSPMVTQLSDSGEVTPRLIRYYVARARGGVGLIILEAVFPRPGGQPGRLGIYDDRFVPGLKSLARAVHEEGGKIAFQINPSRGRSDRVAPVSPSGVPHPLTGVKPKVLSVNEIGQIVKEFGDGAARAKEAGADAIMIHGASGYLLSEFLSPKTNLRHDEYGGDLRKRTRFALELIRVAREKVGPDYPILIRLVGDERMEGGLALEAAVEVSKILQEAGIDAIDIASGAAESHEWIIPGLYFARGYNVPLAEAIKKGVTIPVSVVGRINDPCLANEIIEKGKADFVTVGRALIADPEFPVKAAEGRTEDIRPCIACLRCSENNQQGLPLICSMNPGAGREGEPERKRPNARKRVLVVGGGPAGMQAALTAAERGHQVTLWEKEEKLGGQINLAVVPPHKEELATATRFLEKQVLKRGVQVILEKEATAQRVVDFAPDAVVLATGSSSIVPEIPGIEKGKVVTYRDLLSGRVKIGEKVVVIGGGLVGCETAEAAAQEAKQVIIVEILDRMASDTITEMREVLLKRLAAKGVCLFTGVVREEITEKGVTIEDKQGRRHDLESDQVVIAVGVVPNSGLANELKGRVRDLHIVEDSRRRDGILEAIHGGQKAGLEL